MMGNLNVHWGCTIINIQTHIMTRKSNVGKMYNVECDVANLP